MLLAVPAVVGALTLTACQQGPGLHAARVTAVSGASSSAAVPGTETSAVTATGAPTTRPATIAPAGVVGTGPGGPGSITLTVTAPTIVSGHVDTKVTCDTGRLYRAYVGGTVQGYTLQLSASALHYTGPGSYPATLAGTMTGPDGETFPVAARQSTASLSATGGSVAFSGTGSRGHTISGSVAWACS
jgi:hypothetical protein